MAKVLIVSGSKSNSNLYDKVAAELKKSKCEFKVAVASAHKSPELLDRTIARANADVFIACAGLSAALPGVVASRTTHPVIGIPASDNFSGLDALLSTMQMPPGIPVLSVGVDASNEAAHYAAMILNGKFENVQIIRHALAEKCIPFLEKFKIRHGIVSRPDFNDKNSIFINLVEVNSFFVKKMPSHALVINVPVLEKSKSNDAEKLIKLTSQGLWVGLNRADNAVIAAAEILGKKKELLAYRRELESKILHDNKK